MKPSQSKNKAALAFIFLFSGVIFLSSCLKNNDDFTPTISHFSIVNGYPGLNSVDFWFDGMKANTQPLIYKQSTEYLQAYSGYHRLTITKAGIRDIVADGNIGLETDKYHSVFLHRKSLTDTAVFAVSVEDNLAAPSAGKAKIRLANLTPGDVKIDLSVKGVTDTLFGNLAFTKVSAFKEVDPTVTALEIRENGKPEVKLEVPVTLQAGKIYTVSTNGLWTSTVPATAFGTQITVNK